MNEYAMKEQTSGEDWDQGNKQSTSWCMPSWNDCRIITSAPGYTSTTSSLQWTVIQSRKRNRCTRSCPGNK